MTKTKELKIVRGIEGDGWRFEPGEVVKRADLVKLMKASTIDHWISKGVLEEVVTDGDG